MELFAEVPLRHQMGTCRARTELILSAHARERLGSGDALGLATQAKLTVAVLLAVNRRGMLRKQIRGSIVVSISACHAEDPGSIPGRGKVLHRNGLGQHK